MKSRFWIRQQVSATVALAKRESRRSRELTPKKRTHLLEIIKRCLLGIASAVYDGCSEAGASEPQSNKQLEKQKAVTMLNKLNKRRAGFTLVEIMIVVAIIALLAAIAVPGFLRARKRSQASRILNDLRLIDAAVDQYAIETNKASGNAVTTADWTNYLKKGSMLYNTGADLFGNAYGVQTVDSLPKVPSTAKTALSDVADTSFWSPYQ